MPDSISGLLRKDHPLQWIAFGEDDAWFYKEAPRTGAKSSGELLALLE